MENEVHKMQYEMPGICDCNEKDFYLGFDEISWYRGKRNKMEMLNEPIRVFSDKFMKDPKRAAEVVYLSQFYDKKDTYNKELIEDFWKNAHYDPKLNAYVIEEYETIGTRQTPKPCQMEEFYRGNYEFYKIRHEIQVLRTEPVKIKHMKSGR